MLRLDYSRPDRLLAPTRPEVRPRTKRSVATTIHFGIGALCIQDLTRGRDLVSWNDSPVQVVRRDRSWSVEKPHGSDQAPLRDCVTLWSSGANTVGLLGARTETRESPLG